MVIFLLKTEWLQIYSGTILSIQVESSCCLGGLDSSYDLQPLLELI